MLTKHETRWRCPAVCVCYRRQTVCVFVGVSHAGCLHALLWSRVCLALALLGKKKAEFLINVFSPPPVFFSAFVLLSWFLSLLSLSHPALYFSHPAQWLLRSAVPCCSYQFERMFDTCRIPGTITGSFSSF